jgi:hypothetical protein
VLVAELEAVPELVAGVEESKFVAEPEVEVELKESLADPGLALVSALVELSVAEPVPVLVVEPSVAELVLALVLIAKLELEFVLDFVLWPKLLNQYH